MSFTRLIDTYLSTDGGKKCRCPDRLFGHTHGKDPRNGIEHYNVYSEDDIKHANLNGIQMALIPPNGIVQMFDARFGPKKITDAYKMSPPNGVNIPRDEYYTGIMGPLRRWLARVKYL